MVTRRCAPPLALVLHALCGLTCVRAHLTAVCSSISSSLPDRLVFWLVTYHHGSHDSTRGGATLTDPAGNLRFYTFSNYCRTPTSIDGPTSGTIDYQNQLVSHCSQNFNGQGLVDANSKLTCYVKNPVPLIAGLNWALGEGDQTSSAIHSTGGWSHAKPVQYFYPLPVDNLMTGYYSLNTWDTDETLDPCNNIYDKPCFLGTNSGARRRRRAPQNGTWWFELGKPTGATDCTSPPPSALTAGTSYSASHATFCSNVPDGFICPVSCPAGQRQVGHIECKNGTWTSDFRCSPGPCELPSATNNAGISGANGHPIGIQPDRTTAVCGILSDTGAACEFTCSVPGAWAYGRLVCTSGTWSKQAADADCYSAANDSVWPAPAIQSALDLGGGSLKVDWSHTPDATRRSDVSKYSFQVIPSGNLTCPDYVGRTPPPGGIRCYGGDPANMDAIQVKIRALNKAGWSPWSLAFRSRCDPLVLAPEDIPRFDVSSCGSIFRGASCTVGCAPGYLTDGTPTVNFTCPTMTSSRALVGTYPDCFRQANAPVQVGITSPSTSSLRIAWTDAGLNDVGGALPFSGWVVEVKPTSSSTWQVPTGCTALTSNCVSSCVATGLSSNTPYEARVKASAAPRPAFDSPLSATASGQTLPSAAAAPVNVEIFGTTASTLSVRWQASATQGDCVFSRWQVELQQTSGAWTIDPWGCQNLNQVGTPTCILESLPCDTTFEVRVRQLCVGSLADSPISPGATGTTARDGSCLVPATRPVDLSIVALGPSSARLSWAAGAANDCVFQGWTVRAQRTHAGVLGQFEEVTGCTSLTSRLVTECTATGLKRGAYRFEVAESGVDIRTSSPPSVASTYAMLPLDPARTPTSTRLALPTMDGFEVSWSAEDMRHCTFRRWEVRVQEVGTTTWQSDPAGCSGSVTACLAHCQATGLRSNATYVAQVRALCEEPGAESPYSASSPPLSTEPQRAAKPLVLFTSGITDSSAALAWTAAAASPDCKFVAWEVQVQEVGMASWSAAPGCDGLTARSSVSCTAASLRCSVAYRWRVRELCVLAGATSAYTASQPFTTTAGGSCMRAASPPEYFRLTPRSAASMEVSFATGSAGDCTFAGFEVQAQRQGDATWTSPGSSCALLRLRGAPVCVATGLAEDTAYRFRAREICTNGPALASVWGVSEPARTLRVAPLVLDGRVPEGLITETRPAVLSAILSGNAELDTAAIAGGAALTICPSTSAPEPNSCGCTGASCSALCTRAETAAGTAAPHVYLPTPRMLWYSFGSALAVATGCTYTVSLSPGLLRTEAQPAKSSAAFSWSFTYSPPPPQLQLSLVSAGISSLKLEADWSVPTSFTCSVDSQPASTFTGVFTAQPLQFTLTGLVPSTAYSVTCQGTPVNDRWNVATETLGPFSTEDDPNNLLSSLGVTFQIKCADETGIGAPVAAALVPSFNSSQAGGTFSASLEVSSFRDQCSIPINVSAVPRYLVTVAASAQSPFATLAFGPDPQMELQLDWPANTTPSGNVTETITVEVRPFTTGSAPALYTLDVSLIFTNLKVADVRGDTAPLLLDGTSPLEIDTTMEIGTDTSSLVVFLGSFRQTTTAGTPTSVTVDGRPQMMVTLTVPGATGSGQELPVVVEAAGIRYTSAFKVSFEVPPVVGDNGLPACPLPDAVNSAGISGLHGHPSAIRAVSTMPGCKTPYSESGAECLFTCSASGAWGLGKIICERGIWRKVSSSVDCKPAADDSLWPAPVINLLVDGGAGQLTVDFARTDDGLPRSAPSRFDFDVVPAGELVCPPSPGELPPSGGWACSGGVAGDMGRYEVRVRAVNVAGPGAWSQAAQRACTPLVPPTADAWRYDVSACARLLDTRSCRPTCAGGTVMAGSPQDFVCAPPGSPTGTFPTCLKPAEAPVAVSVAGQSASSAMVAWDDAGLNDCGTLVPFVRWRVQVRPAGGVWAEPAGCLQLGSPCGTTCTATGMIPNTQYDAKVSAVCGQAEANSPESLPGAGSTLPRAADAPRDLRVTSASATTMAIAWNPGSQQGDCVFARWEVELRGPSGTWSNNPEGCQLLDSLGSASCTLLGLACDTTFSLRVHQRCADARADSPVSQDATASTVRDGACLSPAGTPTALTATALSPSSLRLAWAPGAANDCIFQSYLVRVQRTDQFGHTGEWQVAAGCLSLASRADAQCTATGLQRGSYRFYVGESCQDSKTSSAISSASASIDLPLRPAAAPTGLALDSPGQTSLRLSWTEPEFNDCSFKRWFVEVRQVGGSWLAQPMGCRDLINSCASHCEATGLASNTEYEARVSVHCKEPTADGPASALSSRLSTKPVPSTAPVSVLASSPSVSTMELSWVPGMSSADCTFLEWQVQVQIETYAEWRTPEGCDVSTRATTTCLARNLLCGTTYRARVAEVCSPAGASSPYATSAAFATLRTSTCMVGSAGPVAVQAGTASTTSLKVSFSPGNGNDCAFSGFDVQQQMVGSAAWEPAGGSCTSIARRDGPSCVATGLSDGTAYLFRVRERCSNGAALDSPWSVSEKSAQTLLVPPVTALVQLPRGDQTSVRPTAVTVIFGTAVQLPTPTLRQLRICPSTTDPEPNPCGCSGAGCSAMCLAPPLEGSFGDDYARLLSPEVLHYDFSGVLQIGSGCEYTVALDAELLRTQLEPSKASPQLSWSFRYTPQPPRLLQVDLVQSTTTSLRLSLSWSEPTRFVAKVLGTAVVSSPLEFTGVSPVEITLSGLLPSSAYNVEFDGAALTDSWNTVKVTQGVFITQDDTDSRLSQLQVSVRRQCCSTCTPEAPASAQLSPLFDSERVGSATHAVHIDYSAFRSQCSIASTAPAEPRYLVSVSAASRSPFATTLFDPVQAQSELALSWPAGVMPTASVTGELKVEVRPYTGGSTKASTFTVQATLLSSSVVDQALRQAAAGPLPADGSVGLELDVTTAQGVDTSAFRISLGPFRQQALRLAARDQLVNGVTMTISTFSVASPVGVGLDLPVVVDAGALQYELPLRVSFVRPVITGLFTMVNGLPSEPSLLQDSSVVLQGTGLAPATGGSSPSPGPPAAGSQIFVVGMPGSCTDVACQEALSQQLWDQGSPNLCGATTAVSASELRCTLQPSVQNPLATVVMIRNGAGGDWTVGAVADPSAGSQTVSYEDPVVQGMSNARQGLASGPTFSVTGRSFPQDDLSQGFTQLWGTASRSAMSQRLASASRSALLPGGATAAPTPAPAPAGPTPAPGAGGGNAARGAAPAPAPTAALDAQDPASAERGLQPLCSYARRVSDTEIQCQRRPDWQGRALSTAPLVYLQVGPNKLSAAPMAGVLLIPQLVITDVNGSSPYEVGPMELELQGANFGEQINGPLEVLLYSNGGATQAVEDGGQAPLSPNASLYARLPCQVSQRSSSRVRCKFNGTIFQDPLADSEYAFGVGAEDLNGLKNYPVLAQLRFAGTPDNYTVDNADPLQALFRFTVKLFSCSAGQYRASRMTQGCLDCAPGRFKNETGSALGCQPCLAGSFAAYSGLGACQTCEPGYTTPNSGASSGSNCTCAPGFFRDLTDPATGPHGTGVCRPCPAGAICEGANLQPYARHGFWTPDRHRFWACFPADACLQGSAMDPNRCDDTREPQSRRCATCEIGHYRYKGDCYTCTVFDRIVAWVGPILLLLLLWLVIVPCTVRHLRPQENVVVEMVEEGEEVTFVDRIFNGKQPGFLKRITHSQHNPLRMIVLAFNRMQLLWVIGLIPFAWPSILEVQHDILSIFAFDIHVLRPACLMDPLSGFQEFFDLPYLAVWYISWSFPYFIVLNIIAGIAISNLFHRGANDPLYINFIGAVLYVIAVQVLFSIMSHVVDNLLFVNCMSCEDNESCMIDYPLYKCGFDSGDKEWLAMAVTSILALVLVVIPLLVAVIFSIYKSWCWQHGEGMGVDYDGRRPWYVFMSEFWVRDYRGYSEHYRRVAVDLRALIRKQAHVGADMRKVWQHCRYILEEEEWHFHEALLDGTVKRLTLLTQAEMQGKPMEEVSGQPDSVPEDKAEASADVMMSRISDASKEAHGHSTAQDLQESKARWQGRLLTLLARTDEFVRRTGDGLATFARGSLFWTYAWEFFLAVQKVILVVVILLSPSQVSETITAVCLLFMLFMLVMSVDIKPYSWTFLNVLDMVMDILTLYIVIFLQLQWVAWLTIICLAVNGVTVLPVILRLVLPASRGKLDETEVDIVEAVGEAMEHDLGAVPGEKVPEAAPGGSRGGKAASQPPGPTGERSASSQADALPAVAVSVSPAANLRPAVTMEPAPIAGYLESQQPRAGVARLWVRKSNELVAVRAVTQVITRQSEVRVAAGRSQAQEGTRADQAVRPSKFNGQVRLESSHDTARLVVEEVRLGLSEEQRQPVADII